MQIKYFFLLLCVFMTTQSFAQTPAGASTMKMVYFENYPPFSFKDKDGKMQGILIDVLDEALQNRMKISLEHKGYPWERAQSLIKDGAADGFATVATDERKAYADFSEAPVVEATFQLFVPKKTKKMAQLKEAKTLKDLEQFQLGCYIGSGWAKTHLTGKNISWVPKLDATLNMLAAERFDGFVDVSQVIRYQIKELGLGKDIEELPIVFDRSPFRLGIAKKSNFKSNIAKFETVMKDMQKDGTLQKIYNKYGK